MKKYASLLFLCLGGCYVSAPAGYQDVYDDGGGTITYVAAPSQAYTSTTYSYVAPQSVYVYEQPQTVYVSSQPDIIYYDSPFYLAPHRPYRHAPHFRPIPHRGHGHSGHGHHGGSIKPHSGHFNHDVRIKRPTGKPAGHSPHKSGHHK